MRARWMQQRPSGTMLPQRPGGWSSKLDECVVVGLDDQSPVVVKAYCSRSVGEFGCPEI